MSCKKNLSKSYFIKCALVVGALVAASSAISMTTLNYLCYNGSAANTVTVCYDANDSNAESDAKTDINADYYIAYGVDDDPVKINSADTVQLYTNCLYGKMLKHDEGLMSEGVNCPGDCPGDNNGEDWACTRKCTNSSTKEPSTAGMMYTTCQTGDTVEDPNYDEAAVTVT
jgi:hypothetical protein